MMVSTWAEVEIMINKNFEILSQTPNFDGARTFPSPEFGNQQKQFLLDLETQNLKITSGRNSKAAIHEEEKVDPNAIYYTKTLKIFDIFTKEKQNILVEAIKITKEDRVSEDKMASIACGTSTLEWNNNVYFFQRRIAEDTGNQSKIEQTYLQLVRVDLQGLY